MKRDANKIEKQTQNIYIRIHDFTLNFLSEKKKNEIVREM